MRAEPWVSEAIGSEKIQNAAIEAGRRRLFDALNLEDYECFTDKQLRFISNSLELRVYELLQDGISQELVNAAADVFQMARVLPVSEAPIPAAEQLVRLGCHGVLAERGTDFRKMLLDRSIPELPIDSQNWGTRVWATILDVWLRLFRKNGWSDLNAVQERIHSLRSEQSKFEPYYLSQADQRKDGAPAWELISAYHLAKAAELIAVYLSQGSVDRRHDIRVQLEAQFDHAISAANRGRLIERENLSRLLALTAQAFADNSIWTVTRSVNSRVSKFVEAMVSPEREKPIFEMLPPQRKVLREQGLLGSVHRSVVVSLPTSSGKTFIAEFRILQALNQFDHERGWVAYLAPTRALVNQLALRLRQDFLQIGCVVEKVSPALEVDGLEAAMLEEQDSDRQFRILVTTPEKLDLMLRSDWEDKIGRPLTLVIVDEAHGIASKVRGLRLELLLAVINRECRHAQFLLLTPFIENGEEIAQWLAPDSYNNIELGVEWVPNDRVIATVQPQKGSKRGEFKFCIQVQHTTRKTIEIPETLQIISQRPLGLSWSQVSQSSGKLAAATSQVLAHRGTVIVLVDKPRNSWSVADLFKVDENRRELGEDLKHIQNFLRDEMGPDFPLISLLEYGVGVHHSGLSDDTRTLIEWLTERNELRVLIATTTIAQGVNFPVSGVVFGSHQYPYGQEIPSEDFWNIAGRAGRVDQEDLGIVALACVNDKKAKVVEEFIQRSTSALNSTLVEMVQRVFDQGKLLNLETLSWMPEWSSFVQFLAHSYRQTDNHEQFAVEIEQVLRGTLGFQYLRKHHKGWADQLVRGVYNYAERIQGKPLSLVDATGFSWESVSGTLIRLNREGLTGNIWSTDLFGSRRDELHRAVGILLKVPELRESLKEITGGSYTDGYTLTNIICDWVQGRSLSEMATEYFGDESQKKVNMGDVDALTKCCSKIFGRLTQTASWGLSALQVLTMGDAFDSLPENEQRTLRNLPARVYYGVNTDEAVALRILGVPRVAALPLAKQLQVNADESLYQVRKKVNDASVNDWKSALGEHGISYHRIWSIIEGKV